MLCSWIAFQVMQSVSKLRASGGAEPAILCKQYAEIVTKYFLSDTS